MSAETSSLSQTATQPQPVSRPEAWRELRARFRAPPPLAPAAPTEDRVVWFDYAKGICITLVVMMHSALGVGDAIAVAGELVPIPLDQAAFWQKTTRASAWATIR